MISVEIVKNDTDSSSEEVELYFDHEGLDELLARLAMIKEGKTDHSHLMSKTWGLGDLSELRHKESNQVIHHLKMLLVSG